MKGLKEGERAEPSDNDSVLSTGEDSVAGGVLRNSLLSLGGDP